MLDNSETTQCYYLSKTHECTWKLVREAIIRKTVLLTNMFACYKAMHRIGARKKITPAHRQRRWPQQSVTCYVGIEPTQMKILQSELQTALPPFADTLSNMVHGHARRGTK
jgi:hypothetical protein